MRAAALSRQSQGPPEDRLVKLETANRLLTEDNKRLNNVCAQLQSEHEWIVRKLDSECAKVSHVEELYEEVERLHKKLDVHRMSGQRKDDSLHGRLQELEEGKGKGNIHERLDDMMDKLALLDVDETQDVSLEARFKKLKSEVTMLKQQYMPASKEILLVAEHMERANGKLNDYSLQLETRLKQLEDRLTGFERRHEDDILAQVRKNLGTPAASSGDDFYKLVQMLDTKYSRRIANLELRKASTSASGSPTGATDDWMRRMEQSVDAKIDLLTERVNDGETGTNEKLAELLRRVNNSLVQVLNRDEEVASSKALEMMRALDTRFHGLLAIGAGLGQIVAMNNGTTVSTALPSLGNGGADAAIGVASVAGGRSSNYSNINFMSAKAGTTAGGASSSSARASVRPTVLPVAAAAAGEERPTMIPMAFNNDGELQSEGMLVISSSSESEAAAEAAAAVRVDLTAQHENSGLMNWYMNQNSDTESQLLQRPAGGTPSKSSPIQRSGGDGHDHHAAAQSNTDEDEHEQAYTSSSGPGGPAAGLAHGGRPQGGEVMMDGYDGNDGGNGEMTDSSQHPMVYADSDSSGPYNARNRGNPRNQQQVFEAASSVGQGAVASLEVVRTSTGEQGERTLLGGTSGGEEVPSGPPVAFYPDNAAGGPGNATDDDVDPLQYREIPVAPHVDGATWPTLVATIHSDLAKRIEACRLEVTKCNQKIEHAEANCGKALVIFNKSLSKAVRQMQGGAVSSATGATSSTTRTSASPAAVAAQQSAVPASSVMPPPYSVNSVPNAGAASYGGMPVSASGPSRLSNSNSALTAGMIASMATSSVMLDQQVRGMSGVAGAAKKSVVLNSTPTLFYPHHSSGNSYTGATHNTPIILASTGSGTTSPGKVVNLSGSNRRFLPPTVLTG
ncbi:unnamed protein product [Amoebophrya sp. A25]|nr:unnamed protein product [Amoebophrya sp. A25]|eukprot:GSA25T00010375001.1